MTTELIEFEDTQKVLSEALDEALAVFSAKADVRPMVGMIALLDGIIERCTELQPEATAQLLSVHQKAVQRRLDGNVSPRDDFEHAMLARNAGLLLTRAVEQRIEANV